MISLTRMSLFLIFQSYFTLADINITTVNSTEYSNDIDNLRLVFQAYSYSKAAYCSSNQLYPEYECKPCKKDLGKIYGNTDPYPSPAEIAEDFTVDRYYEGKHNIAGFIGHSNTTKTIWLSFRGTEATSISNFFKDAQINLTPLDKDKLNKDIKVHHGFKSSWTYIEDELTDTLKLLKLQYPDYTFGITGHSLGAGIAANAAAELYLNHNIKFDYYITFGQPRCGNGPFAKWWVETFGDRFVRRVVHHKDMVPRLPPCPIANEESVWVYNHFGPELWQKSENLDESRLCYGGEDYSCSRSIPYNPVNGVWDHLHYLDENIGTNVCWGINIGRRTTF